MNGTKEAPARASLATERTEACEHEGEPSNQHSTTGARRLLNTADLRIPPCCRCGVRPGLHGVAQTVGYLQVCSVCLLPSERFPEAGR